MSQVKLKATRPFEYARKKRKPGEVFEAPLQDARILIGLRRAERCEGEAEVDEATPKRRYRRRDMTAE